MIIRPRRNSAELNAEIAEKIAAFKVVFIPYPKHMALHVDLDYLQKLGRKTIGQPQMALRALGPSGSGKSAATMAYIAAVERIRPRTATFVPVLKVDLERGSTPKKLMMSILLAFGDLHAGYGNELALKTRVFACFDRFGTELLIVDEFQHLYYRSGIKYDVTDTLKGMLDAGVVPMAFLGTEEAAPMFVRNLQLNGRMLSPCDLHPLSARKPEDQRMFAIFVAKLEQVVVERGVLPELSNVAGDNLLPGLFEVSNGVIGRVCRLFEAALVHALRRGADKLERADLSWATEHWAMEQAFVDRNPFAGGDHG
ncbi:MAG: TniB family NTP-binding protein [Brevundimonas sp.]